MSEQPASLRKRLVESLYVETMLLADETRSYLERERDPAGTVTDPMDRVAFSVESLRATTRLMHVVAWLLTRRAVEAGELTEDMARSHGRRLTSVPRTPDETTLLFPDEARLVMAATMDLHERAMRLQESIEAPRVGGSPAHEMLERLRRVV